jgi:transcriptional antiterminator RfaH
MRGNEAGFAALVSHYEERIRSVRWYLIHCKPRQDERALENLERQEFECFRPTRRVDKVLSGRRREVVESLFPSYLFIHLDSVNDNWRPVCSTRGVNRIVRFNEQPTPVADSLIENIRRRVEAAPVKETYLKPGDRVVVSDGGFANVEAIFVSDDGDERVMLLLNILRSQHVLSFPLGSVRKL